MPVIKSTNAPINLSPFSMKDIEQQARAILLRAQQKAEQLVTEAQVTAGQLREQAIVEGMIEGRKQGLAKGADEGKKLGQQQALNEHKAQLAKLIESFAAAGKDLNASRKALEAAALTEVVKLAVSIARRVTKQFGQLDPNVLTANISEAMTLVIQSTDVRIAFHPSQRAALNDALPQLKLKWPVLEHVILTDDASIAPGGCRLSVGQGQVDADLNVQIDRIAAELLPAAAIVSDETGTGSPAPIGLPASTGMSSPDTKAAAS